MFGVWFVIKQHVILKVMIIMFCIRVLYKSVLSIYVPFLQGPLGGSIFLG